MQSLILFCFAAIVACAHAEVNNWALPSSYEGRHNDAAYYYPSFNLERHPRDASIDWERNYERDLGRGKVFGSLGSTGDSLFGRGGYRGDIFNDHRGHLQGQAYGERVLGAGGDSSVLGSKFNWNNANGNVRAGLELQKEIGGGSGMKATGEGVWKLDHNTRFVAGGNLQKKFGHDRPEVGVQAAIEQGF